MEIYLFSTSSNVQAHVRLEILFEIVPRFFSYIIAAIVGGVGGSYTIVATFIFLAHFLGTFVPLMASLLFLSHATDLIPCNHQHIAHRFGEWTMLLLGESVLSIVLAPLSNYGRYYLAFFACLFTVQLLQIIHFSSEEFDPSKQMHALSRT